MRRRSRAPILNDYGTIATTETLGQVQLGGLNAYGVSGATVQKQLEAYLIPTADGCVSVVLSRAGRRRRAGMRTCLPRRDAEITG